MRWLPDRPATGVFVILLASYAFFWHSRDWNASSRLMLTYSMVDRRTVSISGLDRQTGDKAKFHGQYYSDKLPGYSILAALPYFVAKSAFGLRTSSRSTQSGSLPLLGGRLLDHPGHIRHLDRLDGGPPRDRGS